MRKALAIGTLVLLGTGFASDAAAQLWRGRGRMDGTVMDTDGAPIEGVVVKAYLPDANGGREVTSDDEGRWAIGGLAGGRWQLDFIKDGFVRRQISLALTEGSRPRPVRMTLERVEPTVDPNAQIADGLVRAADLMNADRFAEARRIYLDLLATYPEAHQLHPLVARAYHGDQQLDDAVRHLRLALEADPGNAAVTMLLGSILVERGDAEEGRRILESVDEDSVGDPAVFVNLGIEILNQATPSAALPYFDKAIERFPDYPDAYYFRGISHLQLGDQAAATADLERFVMLAPDAAEAQAARDMLEQLR